MRAEPRILRFTGAIVMAGVVVASTIILFAVLRPQVFLVGEIERPAGNLTVAEQIEFDSARLAARNNARETGLKVAAGVGALAAALLTWGRLDLSRAERALAQAAHLSERYTRAVEQLGHGTKDVQLGGLYGLEQLGLESNEHERVVIEVICAFIREHGTSECNRQPVTVQAALTILSRNAARWNSDQYDLARAELAGAELYGAELSGADLSGADLSGGTDLAAADLSEAELSGANLSGADLSEADLSGANLSEADLFEANLSGANLSRANLSQARLSGANVFGADLSGANLFGATLPEAKLFGAKSLSLTNLSQARLSGANLSEVDLSGAYLSGANLSEADLTGAHLEKSDLSGAQLEGANLTGAHLEGVQGLSPAQMEKVIGLSEATGVPPELLGT